MKEIICKCDLCGREFDIHELNSFCYESRITKSSIQINGDICKHCSSAIVKCLSSLDSGKSDSEKKSYVG